MSTESSSEFRSVHAARAALSRYKKSKNNLEIIRVVKNIDRYDVWQTVFRDEKEAIKELQIKELYEKCIAERLKGASAGLLRLQACLLVTILTQFVEWKTQLTVEEGVKIIKDSLGEKFMKVLLNEAEKHLEMRLEIVKPYNKHDDEWVGYSRTVVEALK